MCRLATGVSTAALALGLLATPALAQSASPAVTAAATEDDNVIVVTAQRRAQPLQDVPISISVVGADTIEQQGINDFGDLAFKIPNVAIFENSNLAGRTSVTIRGVPGRAGIFVDDVYVGDDSGINGLLVDIDRVEVLRGPQGTLFGRNSISGAINTITRKPGDTLFAQAKLRYGSYNSRYAAAAVGGPLGSGLSAKVSGAYRAADGYDRIAGGGRVNGDDSYAFQAQLRYRPTDRIDLLISGDYEKDDARTGYTDAVADFSINGAPGDIFRNAARDGDPYDRIVPVRSAENREQRKVYGVSAHADIDFGGVKLASITAYRKIDFLYNRDGDSTSFDIITGTQPVKYHQFSQELRLLSPTGGAFEWMIGAYFFKDKRTSSDSNFLGTDFIVATAPALAAFAPPLVPGGAAGALTIGRLYASPLLQSIVGIPVVQPFLGTQVTNDSNEITSYAGFGSATYRPFDKLELTAGVRYTRERVKATYNRTVDGQLIAFVPPVSTQFLDSGWDDNFSPTASVIFKPSKHVTAYFTYSEGFRSGGFNTAPPAISPPANDAETRRFKPEKVTNYEIGLKSSVLDGQLVANVALFKMKYKDFQRAFYQIDPIRGAISSTFNTAASMEGIEIDLVARPTKALTVSASYGYQNSTYDNYPNAPIPSYLVTGDPLQTDLTGQSLPFVPKHTAQVAVEYELPLGSLVARVGSDLQLRSDYNVTDGVDLIRTVDSTIQLGVHAGFGDARGRWQITGRVYNLTNAVYRTGLDYNTFVGTVYQTLSAPRTVAIEGSVKF